MSGLGADYTSPWVQSTKWLYLLTVVFCLLLPVFYTIYISFNDFGFGSPKYRFTLDYYVNLFKNEQILESLKWTMLLSVLTVAAAVPMSLLAAKFYKQTRFKVPFVILMLMPLFIPADIMASSLLVYFKNLSFYVGGWLEVEWFDLSWFTAWIGQILWTMPYAFVVILITMSRYRVQQTEAARTCGATGWQAFWQVEFPQIRPGVFSSCAFVFILSFNEYTRTNLLNGGFDTFTTYVVNYMLSTGMDPEVYAMSSMISVISIVVIVSAITYLLSQPELRETEERQDAESAA
ncbi:MAG: ABC transporter permease subunit [SAR324 cluster bacterium]|nr:ABC transporter permease subunit [SAR324 cluster bacterium]